MPATRTVVSHQARYLHGKWRGAAGRWRCPAFGQLGTAVNLIGRCKVHWCQQFRGCVERHRACNSSTLRFSAAGTHIGLLGCMMPRGSEAFSRFSAMALKPKNWAARRGTRRQNRPINDGTTGPRPQRQQADERGTVSESSGSPCRPATSAARCWPDAPLPQSA